VLFRSVYQGSGAIEIREHAAEKSGTREQGPGIFLGRGVERGRVCGYSCYTLKVGGVIAGADYSADVVV
jgi:hypothetical protein